MIERATANSAFPTVHGRIILFAMNDMRWIFWAAAVVVAMGLFWGVTGRRQQSLIETLRDFVRRSTETPRDDS